MKGQTILILGLIGLVIGAIVGEIANLVINNVMNTFYETMYQTNPTPATAYLIANSKSAYNILSVGLGAVGGLTLLMLIGSKLG
jgi:ABC-type lipoprotein release transport system permease subunit